LVDLIERQQKLYIEVVNRTVGRALGAPGLSDDSFALPIKPFEHVGRCRNARVVETREQMRPIALRRRLDMVEELGRRGTQAPSCRLVAERLEVGLQTLLRLLRVGRAVRPVGLGTHLVGHPA